VRQLVVVLLVALLGCQVRAPEPVKTVVSVGPTSGKPVESGAPSVPCAKVNDTELLDVDEAFGKRISTICLAGLPKQMEADIRAYLRLKPSSVLTEERLGSDVRALYDSGFFSQVEATARAAGDAVELRLRMELRREIHGLEINGAPNLDSGERDRLRMEGLAVGTILTPTRLRQQMAELRRWYVERGFADVKIDHTLVLDDRNGATIRITVVEGRRAKKP
jgi:outer membrane protein insertion porin family